jgi:hypothetical protein
MPKRVGTLTFHQADNHGAVLQAYALVAAIRELGHDPRVIDYRPLAARRIYNRFGLRSGIPVQTLVRRWKFRRFRQRYLPVTSRRYLTPEALRANPPDVDCVICGSDQIWNVYSYRSYDPAFFVDFVADPKVRKASYAACMGWADDFGPHSEEIRGLLDRFDRLSVRNIHTQQRVRELTGRTPVRVLDPTFLANFDEITPPSRETEPYIFVYCLQRSEVFDKSVALVSESMRLPVISIGMPFQNARTLYAAGPLQWLTLIRNAKFVITNSFHGTCFSIFNRTDFLTLWLNESKSRRHRDILDWFGLPQRLIVDSASLDAVREKGLRIDFAEVDNRVATAREESWQFLSETLGD